MPVYVVDDDASIRALVRANFEKRGHQVSEAADGPEAMRMIRHQTPDLVILDLVLPEMNGIDVCSWIRKQSDVPVIVLSARSDEPLKVRALDIGADDYITKPFGQAELMARVRAVMRRTAAPALANSEEVIELGKFVINLKTRRAFIGERDLRLTRTEFALLAELATHLDAILTHDELLVRVWGEEFRGSNHYLHVYLGRIRKKMGEKYEELLESVPGFGYILHTPRPASGS
jgi:two-component system KDP operon response regulator KdpE